MKTKNELLTDAGLVQDIEAWCQVKYPADDTERIAYLTEALPLYRSAGYVDIPAYNDNPYAAHWLEKDLR